MFIFPICDQMQIPKLSLPRRTRSEEQLQPRKRQRRLMQASSIPSGRFTIVEDVPTGTAVSQWNPSPPPPPPVDPITALKLQIEEAKSAKVRTYSSEVVLPLVGGYSIVATVL